MIAYIDASAAGKLFVNEPESAAMADHLAGLEDDDLLVSCDLLETELRRMATRHDISQQLVTHVLDGIGLIHPEREFFREAGLLPGQGLRSLDALHVTTAIKADVDVLVAYDLRLLEAARGVGIHTLSPA